ncbi:MAG: glycosyl hydrolase family 17 protein [Planctomycetota bacterium]
MKLISTVCVVLSLSVLFTGCSKPFAENLPNTDMLQQTPDALLEGTHRAICYSGFRSGQHPDLGKGAKFPSEAEILEDMQILTRDNNFNLMRVYTADPGIERTLKVIRDNNVNMKVLLGAWIDAEIDNHEYCHWLDAPQPQEELDAGPAANKAEIADAIRLANEYEDIVVAVSVGNESMVYWSDHKVKLDTMISYIRKVKAAVKQPVTVDDYFTAWLEHGEKLARELDFITVHTYPLWADKDIEEGMSFTVESLLAVKRELPDYDMVIGEIGWATIGTEFGEWASEEKQERFYHEIMDWAKTKNITTFFFEAFDEDWKGNNADLRGDPMGAEKHWGIFTVDRKAKKVMHDLYPDLKP